MNRQRQLKQFLKKSKSKYNIPNRNAFIDGGCIKEILLDTDIEILKYCHAAAIAKEIRRINAKMIVHYGIPKDVKVEHGKE